jgi:hypothetical protein
MKAKFSFLKIAYQFFLLCIVVATNHAHACTISEEMEDSLPLDSIEIPNSDRLRIVNMVMTARQWPDTQIRAIVYAGGYIKEYDAKFLADRRANVLKDYLVQLGIGESNVWVDTRIIKKPDVDHVGNETLNQIAVTLVPICDGGCDRLCNDSRVTPTSKIIK